MQIHQACNSRWGITCPLLSPDIDKRLQDVRALGRTSAHATHDFARASHDPSNRRIIRIGPWFEINGFCLVIGEILAIVPPS
jgi:hypothetical protein